MGYVSSWRVQQISDTLAKIVLHSFWRKEKLPGSEKQRVALVGIQKVPSSIAASMILATTRPKKGAGWDGPFFRECAVVDCGKKNRPIIYSLTTKTINPNQKIYPSFKAAALGSMDHPPHNGLSIQGLGLEIGRRLEASSS